MVDFKFTAETTARTKTSAVVGAGMFIFRKLDLKENWSSTNDQDTDMF